MSASVFPARAGMSPEMRENPMTEQGVPRASGDEPGDWRLDSEESECSPRERG